MLSAANLPEDASGWSEILDDEASYWRALGACVDNDVTPPRYFFPESSDASVHVTRIVRKVCAGCVVKRPCLELALRRRAEGTWAGTTKDQRRSFVRELELLVPDSDAHDLAITDAVTTLLEVARVSCTTGSYGPADPDSWAVMGESA